jgi:hypothetical protein
MANPIAAAHPDPKSTSVAPQPAAVAPPNKTAASPVPKANALPADTVTISNAAKAALQEATESKAQTTKEAHSGDHQAQRLLAKENSQQSTK